MHGMLLVRRTSEKVIAQAAANATDNNIHCMPGRLDSRVCFFPCARYNYWEECYTSFNTPLLFNDPGSFQLHNVKVMQFVVSSNSLSTLAWLNVVNASPCWSLILPMKSHP